MGKKADLDRGGHGAEVRARQVQDISRLLPVIGGPRLASIITFSLCNSPLSSAIVKKKDPRIFLNDGSFRERAISTADVR